jgi:FdhD protein
MRTPGDDAELVTGLLHAEGVVRQAGDIVNLSFAPGERRTVSDSVVVTLRPDVAWDVRGFDRGHAATSACGLCGRLQAIAVDEGRACPAGRPTFDEAFVRSLPGRLRRGQDVFDETGGLHAAALVGIGGDREIVREDVGRHNAVDKCIGAALESGWLPGHDLLLTVSGRVAYEIVQKAVTAGVPAVVAIGAPSSLAVEAARAVGLTLVGFVRGTRFNVYAGWDRITG